MYGDFKTPNLGFCSGSKGTRDDPSGLTSRLRSVFLNSEGHKHSVIFLMISFRNFPKIMLLCCMAQLLLSNLLIIKKQFELNCMKTKHSNRLTT